MTRILNCPICGSEKLENRECKNCPLNFEMFLEQARSHIRLSTAASEEAHDRLMDAGYPKLRARNKAVEELRTSIERLIEATDQLAARITEQERRRKRFRF